MKTQITISNLHPRCRYSITLTSTDCSMVWMADITCYSPGTLSPLMACSATSSTFMTEASASEDVEVQELSPSVTDDTGKQRRKRSQDQMRSQIMILFT